MMDRIKAINVAVRFHFCNVNGIEQAVYEALLDMDGDELLFDLPYIPWNVFEQFDVSAMLESIDNLADDILITSEQ